MTEMDESTMHRPERRKTLTGDQARIWREGLGLSVTKAGESLNLSNPNVTFRAYERGKSPAPPTVALMDMIACVALALAKLRDGNVNAAESFLLAALPEPVLHSMERPHKAPPAQRDKIYSRP